MKRINDFGMKIGGAKKDFWAMLKEMSEGEKSDIANREALWKRPNYQSLVKDVPREVLFWRNEVRKSIKATPDPGYNVDGYIRTVTSLKEKVDACTSMKDICLFYKNSLSEFLVQDDAHTWKYSNPSYAGYFDGNVMLRYVNSGGRITKDCEQAMFLLPRAEKEARKYAIVNVTKNILESEASGEGFYNHIALPGARLSIRDSQDWSSLFDQSEDGILRLVIYGNRKLGLCFSDKEANDLIADHKAKNEKSSSRKEAFLPPHLSRVERDGSNYSYFRMSDPNVLSARYGLRGGEFGNYETGKDRLASLNMAYDAFEDLASALGIKARDIGLDGKLAIAFGARGRGAALAHYEPEKNVINITRYRGAGSLAHEWGHALDMYLGTLYKCGGFMSNMPENAPLAAARLINSMFIQNGEATAFSRGSAEFDKSYQKSGNGYWSSAHEMFARAFACYVHDKLGDKRSDYLIGHAEFARVSTTSAIPEGKEREEINHNFDLLFEYLIQSGVFHAAEKTVPADGSESQSPETFLYTGVDGQIKFC